MVIQMTPRGLLRIFLRHRYKFAMVFLPVFLFAAAYCFVIAVPRYESDASLLVKFADSQTNQAGAMPSTGIAAAQLERIQIVNSQIGLMQSQDLLTDALKSEGLLKLYPAMAEEPDPNLRMAGALKWLNRDLDIEPAKNANVITLALLHPDPVIGAQFLNKLIDIFINKQWSIYQNSQLPFMQQQLDQARQKLEASRAAVEQYKAQNGISSLDQEQTLLLKQQSDAQENLTQAISNEDQARGRFAQLEQMLKSMPASIALSNENDRFKAVDDDRSRLDDLLSRQKQMADNYRADSQPMQTLTAQINFAKQQLASASKESAARIVSGANPVWQNTQIELMKASGDQFGASASRASYEAALQHVRDKLDRLEAESQKLDSLTLQQQVDEENFRNYLQAVNDARVSDDLNRQRISSIAVIQSPTIPVEPTRPRTKIVVPAAFLLGLALAIGVMLMAEMFDETFSTPEQIEAMLGLPVLGSFTRFGRQQQRLLPPPRRALPAGVKLALLLVFLLSATVAPAVAFGMDKLDPAAGQSLVVRDQQGQVSEILIPHRDRFLRQGATGQNLGWAQRMGSDLEFFDPDGRQTASARQELLPANYPVSAVAVLRDLVGNPIGVLSLH